MRERLRSSDATISAMPPRIMCQRYGTKDSQKKNVKNPMELNVAPISERTFRVSIKYSDFIGYFLALCPLIEEVRLTITLTVRARKCRIGSYSLRCNLGRLFRIDSEALYSADVLCQCAVQIFLNPGLPRIAPPLNLLFLSS
jgi:hypothetical protein